MFQNGVWQDKLEDSWIQLHIEHSKCARNTISCRHPVTGSGALSVESLFKRVSAKPTQSRYLFSTPQYGFWAANGI